MDEAHAAGKAGQAGRGGDRNRIGRFTGGDATQFRQHFADAAHRVALGVEPGASRVPHGIDLGGRGLGHGLDRGPRLSFLSLGCDGARTDFNPVDAQ